jgi:hypothetical protein
MKFYWMEAADVKNNTVKCDVPSCMYISSFQAIERSDETDTLVSWGNYALG